MTAIREVPQTGSKIMKLMVLTRRQDRRQSTMNQVCYNAIKQQLTMTQHVVYPFSNVYYGYIQESGIIKSPPDSKTLKIQAKERKPRTKKVRDQNFIMGRWSTSETLQYIRFLQENYKEFKEGGQSRRLKKTFVRMGNQIGTRDAGQCRSHHQKMLNFRNTIPQIIAFFKDKYSQLVDWSEPQNVFTEKIMTSGMPFKMIVDNNRITIEIRESQIKTYNPFD